MGTGGAMMIRVGSLAPGVPCVSFDVVVMTLPCRPRCALCRNGKRQWEGEQ